MSFALPDALFFTGIDWAAETHAVCVMDAGGKITAGFTIEHSADGIATLIRRLARYGSPAVCRSPSSARTAAWWTCCWRPGTRWCRSSRTRSRPGGTARCCRAPSPTPGTPR